MHVRMHECTSVPSADSSAQSEFFSLNQSIKGPYKATRGQKRSHIPAPPKGAANPASQSDARFGGCERVATALICETRSFKVFSPTLHACEGGGAGGSDAPGYPVAWCTWVVHHFLISGMLSAASSVSWVGEGRRACESTCWIHIHL